MLLFRKVLIQNLSKVAADPVTFILHQTSSGNPQLYG